MGKFLWESREKSLSTWLSQFSFVKLRQSIGLTFFPTFSKGQEVFFCSKNSWDGGSHQFWFKWSWYIHMGLLQPITTLKVDVQCTCIYVAKLINRCFSSHFHEMREFASDKTLSFFENPSLCFSKSFPEHLL